MTHQTKLKVKMDFYHEAKKSAVTCLQTMKAQPGEGVEPNSWEGVMEMVADTFRRGNAKERASAVLAAAKWSWANCECEIHRHVEETANLLEAEAEAAKSESEAVKHEPEAVKHDPGVTKPAVK